MNTTDATLKTPNEMEACQTQQINAVLFAMACQSLFEFSYGIVVSTEMKKVKILTRTHKTGRRKSRKGLGLVLCKRENTH